MIKGYIYVLSCLAIIASPDPFAIASDWQDILEPEFDIVDTFNHYNDWVGEAANNSCGPSNIRYTAGGSPNLYQSHCYWDRTAPADSRPNVIDDFPNDKVVEGKGMRINWLGNGDGNQEIGSIKSYIGDGSWTSGYDSIYIFFSMYMPSDRFVTRTTSASSRDAIGNIKEGENQLWLNSGKWVCVSMGFVDEAAWGPSASSEHDCRWGWSEVHFHLKNEGSPRYPVVTLGSGGTYFSTISGHVDISSFLNRKIWVELYLKRETSIGKSDGEAKVTFYDENGQSTVVLDASGVSLHDPDSACVNTTGVSLSQGDQMKFNRLNFESNWRVADSGDKYYVCGSYYDSSGNKVRDLSCEWYMDDLIIDDQPVGEKYFALYSSYFGGGGNPQPPSAPLNLRLRQ
jgi:hypothetical protein